MKIIKNILLGLVFIFLLIFVAGFIFVWFNGKTLVKQQLSSILKEGVNLSSVSLKPPFSLEIKDLDISGFAKIDKIDISPILVGFSHGRMILGQVSLISPRLSSGRKIDGNWNLPEGILEKMREKGGKPTLVSGIFIKDGTIEFTDETKSPPFSLTVKNINLDVGNKILSFNPILTRFDISAEIFSSSDKEVGALTTSGWVDFIRKDMKGTIELSGLDAVFFLPVYGKYVTSDLKSAMLDFKSDLAAKSNDLTANCRLVIRDLVFEKPKDETAPSISIFDIVAGGLQTENKEVNIDFVIKTKLDKPRIDLVKLSGNIMAKAFGEQVIDNPQQTVDKIKSVGKEFEKFGKSILKEKFGIDLGKKEEDAAASPPQQEAVNAEKSIAP